MVDGVAGPRGPLALVRGGVGELWEGLAALWRRSAAAAVGERGFFAAALSGGRTPEGFYRRLGGERGLPWERTHLFLADERLVPEGSPESNIRLVRESLVRGLDTPPAGVHAVPRAAEGDPVLSATAYERDLLGFFAPRGLPAPVFDLVLLGIGEDGHTASLFPGEVALEAADRCVVGVAAHASHGARVSLTLACINRARLVAFLATGASKRAAVASLIAGDGRIPAARVRPSVAPALLFADRAALPGDGAGGDAAAAHP